MPAIRRGVELVSRNLPGGDPPHLIPLHLPEVSRCVSHGDHERARIEKKVACDD
jgi:hypothetical protein